MLRGFQVCSTIFLAICFLQLCDWTVTSEAGKGGQKVDATFTMYDEFQVTEYDKLLPPPETNTWYYTSLKCKTNLGGDPGASRREEIVLVTLQDSNEDVGIHRAFILVDSWVGSSLTRLKPLEVFDSATRNMDYPISPGVIHGSSGYNPDHASFDLVHLTDERFPEIVVTLHFSGGSYAPLFVAVLSQHGGQLKVTLRARGGLKDFNLEYKDLNGDGRDEILLPDEITVAGVDHASCPNWISCYTWNGSSFVLENKLFYTNDPRIEVNILDRYNWALVRSAEVHGRQYYEEYEYYLGLINFYKGKPFQAAHFLERVSQRATDRAYAEAARSLLKSIKRPSDSER